MTNKDKPSYYEQLRRNDLRYECKKLKLKGYGKLNKQQLIDLLKANDGVVEVVLPNPDRRWDGLGA